VLTSLLASFNRLHAPPAQLAVFGRSLKKLHLGCNALGSVDALLPSMTRLVELTLEGNELESLPPAIGALRKLRELWVHGNRLRSLPPQIGECAALTVLQCHHNQLTDLPDAFARLGRLQGLYLQSNRLTRLASLRERVLRHLPLQNLGLGNNRFDLSEAFELEGVRVGLGWNVGAPPPPLARFEMWLATSDHAFEPACAGVRAQILVVAFSAQGPGMQQWIGPVTAARAAGVQLDALYVADPSNSYYLQDPSGQWDGLRYYEDLVQRHARHYSRVLLVGSSMGASAALQHARLARRVIAFAPRIDLTKSHGKYVPEAVRAASLEHTFRALETMRGSAAVHVGRGNYVDLAQVRVIEHLPSVSMQEHDTYHHNVPQYMQQQGTLGAWLKDELVALLLPKVLHVEDLLMGA
jgi:hypothetical protein